MKLRVLFFGAAYESTGSREIEIEVGEAGTVGVLVESLTRSFPRLASHKIVVSVNQEYASPEVAISGDDEIAIFTPVSGG